MNKELLKQAAKLLTPGTKIAEGRYEAFVESISPDLQTVRLSNGRDYHLQAEDMSDDDIRWYPEEQFFDWDVIWVDVNAKMVMHGS
jgi:hypothetical protein